MTGRDEIDTTVESALRWLEAGHGAAIATVVKSWGSAPRRPGAWLAVRDDGIFEGSVSGGCVEGDVIAEAVARAASGGSRLMHFGVDDGTAWQSGLACGGEIDVLVQSLDDRHFPPEILRQVSESRRAGRAIALSADLESGRTWVGADGAFSHRVEPPLRLVIVGAGHISQYLAPLASQLGYDVRIVDPRSSFAAGPRFAGFPVDDRWPDEAMADWQPDRATAVVALSHDPKLDDPALILALRSPAFYIAALGSRSNQKKRMERLALEGFSQADLARVEGPAGLPIGAVTPSEIAISILASMIATWRRDTR